MKRKYFTFENTEKINKRLLNEVDIEGLPTLGIGVDFGLGEICLEETEDKYRFYFAAGRNKFHYREFDNIEDGINELTSYYKKWNMVDKPNKMEKIIYQELGLEREIFDSDKIDTDSFFTQYNESRELTQDELKAIYVLNKILEEDTHKFYEPVFGSEWNGHNHFGDNCIFKIDDDSWVVWQPTSKKIAYFPRNFDNVNEACELMIDRCLVIDEENDIATRVFYDMLYEEINDAELDKFAKNIGYNRATKGMVRKRFLYTK